MCLELAGVVHSQGLTAVSPAPSPGGRTDCLQVRCNLLRGVIYTPSSRWDSPGMAPCPAFTTPSLWSLLGALLITGKYILISRFASEPGPQQVLDKGLRIKTEKNGTFFPPKRLLTYSCLFLWCKYFHHSPFVLLT